MPALTRQQKKSKEFWDAIHRIQAENNNCSTQVAREIYNARKANNGSIDPAPASGALENTDPTHWSVEHIRQVAQSAATSLRERIAEHQRQITALNDALAHWDRVLAEGEHQTKLSRARQSKAAPALSVH